MNTPSRHGLLAGKAGHRCVSIRGDLAEEANCQRAVDQTVGELGGLDILAPR